MLQFFKNFEDIWMNIAMTKGAESGTISHGATMSMMYNELRLDAGERFPKHIRRPSSLAATVVPEMIVESE